MPTPFVPDDFDPPLELVCADFRLEPLGPQHNERDHAAWTTSIEHIRATPGFGEWKWPPAEGMSLEANRRDLARHADDFANRRGFTYSVLSADHDEVIGCIYIYPARDGEHDAAVHSWVRAQDADLDIPLHAAVSRWLSERWPFARPAYASREN
jgi:RimJ/RimL family protein N-acetyltransferase